MMNFIELENVSVYYNKFCALNSVNLNIREKEFLAVIGPNGGGKSTLLKTILGFKEPKYGEIKIKGKESKQSRSYVGYVPQASKFDKQFPISVKEVVLMGKLNGNIRAFWNFTKNHKDKSIEIMKKIGIYDLKDRQIGELSAGQLQKVLIARALVLEPEILLLDEPTASLDLYAKMDIYNLLKELNKEITIVLVTHDIDMASKYVTDIVFINREVYYCGEIQKFKNVIEKSFNYSAAFRKNSMENDSFMSYMEGCND